MHVQRYPVVGISRSGVGFDNLLHTTRKASITFFAFSVPYGYASSLHRREPGVSASRVQIVRNGIGPYRFAISFSYFQFSRKKNEPTAALRGAQYPPARRH